MKIIKGVGKAVSLEHDADPRVAKLFARLGFEKALPAFIHTR